MLEQYVKDALRTEQHSDKRQLHSKMGIQTECGEAIDTLKRHIFYGKEIDYINLQEEIGDIMWYIALAIADKPNEKHELTFMWDRGMCPTSQDELVLNLYYHLNQILKVQQVMTINQIREYLYHTDAMCHLLGVSLEEVCRMNINKLKTRYPEKFTEEAALNRDLNAERKALED